jgi:hypothetical protein
MQSTIVKTKSMAQNAKKEDTPYSEMIVVVICSI